ncbi:thioredoxin family protein [Hugenholtzia roseola]|uniref:thioredoxin family protein n=1 Tax=Hugenholtzia roseola TaxID=1002 RepID=UPI0003FA6210|nr:thioredoxin family protein [Hugenholtzia roseola]
MQNLKKSLFLLLAIAFVGLASFTLVGDGYKVGAKIKGFQLKNVDGKTVSLADYQNNAKGIILTFTCNHCPYAKLYEDRLIALHNRFKDEGYPVVAINPNGKTVEDDSFENMVARAKEKGYPFAYLLDEDQKVAQAFGAEKTPHIYLLKNVGDGFEVVYIGAIDDDPQNTKENKVKFVENAIIDLQQGRSVANTNTKAVGCTIKWLK